MATEPMPQARPLLRVDPSTGQLQEQTYEVSVLRGPDEGRTAVLRDALVIGTHESAGLKLTDTNVSRYHAELIARSDGVVVRDLKSTNGTFLGAGRVEEALLVEAEATVRVGKTVLRVARSLAPAASAERATFGAASSESPAMRRIFGILEVVAPSDATVLLGGETGTGKDVVARAVHAASRRAAYPFVVVDCAAIAGNLIESELFGHTRGAFTGAVAARAGAFLDANRGTLFLDEIGELPLELQPKLLRVLEAGTIKHVGDDRHRPVDVRVIAATHRDLDAEVRAGRFRQDLYYRLAIVPVRLPPLRDRPEDIAPLVRHFLRELGRDDFELPAATLAEMQAYRWPGNVRELRNVVAQAVAGFGTKLTSENAPARPVPVTNPSEKPPPFKEAKNKLVDDFTRAYLQDLSNRYNGNISTMAQVAGIARHYLRDLMVKHGLRKESDEP